MNFYNFKIITLCPRVKQMYGGYAGMFKIILYKKRFMLILRNTYEHQMWRKATCIIR